MLIIFMDIIYVIFYLLWIFILINMDKDLLISLVTHAYVNITVNIYIKACIFNHLHMLINVI